jgi:hypothetical protein
MVSNIAVKVKPFPFLRENYAATLYERRTENTRKSKNYTIYTESLLVVYAVTTTATGAKNSYNPLIDNEE